ncbi:hypothetical protein K449DRAFT_31833 [Hypoxylon sp. EC38]|nr:hypothetical protein K449DRAFT_31833 [Hypoxylon sp. EC38]
MLFIPHIPSQVQLLCFIAKCFTKMALIIQVNMVFIETEYLNRQFPYRRLLLPIKPS